MTPRTLIKNQNPLVIYDGDLILNVGDDPISLIVVTKDIKIVNTNNNISNIDIEGLLWNYLPDQLRYEYYHHLDLFNSDQYIGNIHHKNIPLSYQLKYRNIINIYLKKQADKKYFGSAGDIY